MADLGQTEKQKFHVDLEAELKDRIDAVKPAICKATGLHSVTTLGAVHHLLDLAVKSYEQPK